MTHYTRKRWEYKGDARRLVWEFVVGGKVVLTVPMSHWDSDYG